MDRCMAGGGDGGLPEDERRFGAVDDGSYLAFPDGSRAISGSTVAAWWPPPADPFQCLERRARYWEARLERLDEQEDTMRYALAGRRVYRWRTGSAEGDFRQLEQDRRAMRDYLAAVRRRMTELTQQRQRQRHAAQV